jgi:hypothetical protein
MINFMLQPLYPQKHSFWYPLDRWLDGPQSQFGHCGRNYLEEMLCIGDIIASDSISELDYGSRMQK